MRSVARHSGARNPIPRPEQFSRIGAHSQRNCFGKDERLGTMDFKLIGKLCECGVDFAPTAAGMTRSNVLGGQNIATTDKE